MSNFTAPTMLAKVTFPDVSRTVTDLWRSTILASNFCMPPHSTSGAALEEKAAVRRVWNRVLYIYKGFDSKFCFASFH